MVRMNHDDFGSCIAISDDGLTVAAGAPFDGYGDPGCGDGCGRVRIFTYDDRIKYRGIKRVKI